MLLPRSGSSSFGGQKRKAVGLILLLVQSIYCLLLMTSRVQCWTQRDSTSSRNRYLSSMTKHHGEFIGKFPASVGVSSFDIVLDEKTNQMLSIYWNFTAASERLIAFDVLNGGKTLVSSNPFPPDFSRLNENRPVMDVQRSFMYLPRVWKHRIWYVLRIDTSRNVDNFGDVKILLSSASETEIVDLAIHDDSTLCISSKDKVTGLNVKSLNSTSQPMWTVSNFDENTVEFGTILSTKNSLFVATIQKAPSQINPYYAGLIQINSVDGTVIHRTVFSPSLATKTPVMPSDVVLLDGGYILTTHQSSNISMHLTLYHERDITHPVSQYDLRIGKYLPNFQRFQCSNILGFIESKDDDNSFSILCSLSETEILVNTVTVLLKFSLIDKGSASTRILLTEESVYNLPRFYLCNSQLVTFNHGGGGEDNGDNFSGDYYGFICDHQIIVYSQSGDGEAASRLQLDPKVSAFRGMIGANNNMVYVLNDFYLQSLRNNIQ